MKHLHSPRARAHVQRGISLLEVLVAMLIFMLGILGLVGLQSSMTRAQTEAKFRADAANLATEAFARMWADLPNLNNYNGSSCASVQRCKEWQDKVSAALPQGSGAVTLESATGNATATVSWTTAGGEPRSFTAATTVSRSGG